ncbi:MAG: hypothetical protein JWM53_3518 [bacterium]|nr:hypothetical protein [bacterium]
MAFTVANHVGRLIEVRIKPPLRKEQAARFMQEVVRVSAAHPTFVACTDLRASTRTTDPDTIDVIAGIMRSESPRVERTALIVSAASSTLLLQLDRLVKSAGAAQRRIFRTRQEAESWLDEVLDDAERERLRAFLDEGTTSP